MSITIRPANIQDVDSILYFINQLAVYEKAPEQVKATPQKLIDSLFSDGATAHALLCEQDGEAIGFAVYFYNYSTWLGQNGLYLEDLYIDPGKRGQGAGKAIMQYLAKQAVAKNCGRFEWVVLDWNQSAIDFYNSIGGEPQNEWIIYRLTGNALSAFANND